MKNIFIYNLESGRKNLKKYLDFIVSSLKQKFGEIETVATTYAGHAFDIAKNAEGYDNIIVAGGDGTLNEVINGIGGLKNKPTISLIPTGTVNDVARSLGIKRTIKGAVKNILNGEPISHDIFKVNDKYGIYVCCAGLFSKSSYNAKRKVKKKIGKLAYFFKGVKEIFESKPIDIDLKTDSGDFSGKCSLLLILNSRSVAGFRINKNALLNDNKVEIVVFKVNGKQIHLIDILRIVNTFLYGIDHIKNKSYVKYFQVSKFELSTSEDLPINLDGEKSTSGNFKFECINNGIKIIVPRR